MRARGFSIVELSITIVVMAILAALVVAGLRQSAISARNDERRTKAEILARGLESYHGRADNRYSTTDRPPGRYPSSNDVLHALGWDIPSYNPSQIVGGYPDSFLTGVPGEIVQDIRLVSFIVFGVKTPDNSEDILNSDVKLDEWAYQPTLYNTKDFYGDDRHESCIGDSVCTSFNLYYKVENFDGSIDVEVIRSQHQ